MTSRVKSIAAGLREWRGEIGDREAASAAHEAIDLVAGGREGKADGAQFVIVTKAPHVTSPQTVETLVARALAFGIRVRSASQLVDDSAEDIAATLYDKAHRYYASLECPAGLLPEIEQRFDVDGFEEIFGVHFGPGMVKTGKTALREAGLDERELMSIWESGRKPIGRDDLVRIYGSEAADFVLQGEGSYDWFRGSLPMGIQRIRSGVMAFALREPRLGAEPVVVLNGHFPGLSEVFSAVPWVLDCSLGNLSIQQVRSGLIGDDNLPAKCPEGTIRGDAWRGHLELDSERPLDGRLNAVHCSDGLISGAIEHRDLLGAGSKGWLQGKLTQLGYGADEIEKLVLADPVVDQKSGSTVSELTRGADAEETIEKVRRWFPSILPGGLTFPRLDSGFARLGEMDWDCKKFSVQDERVGPPVLETRSGEPDRGIELMRRGGLGLLVPAGGTGGRFGGYDLPENDIRRQKPLAPVFDLAGEQRSSLDIRLANLRWWERKTGGSIPMGIMGSGTSRSWLADWMDSRPGSGMELFAQEPVFRLDRSLLSPGVDWADAVLRDSAGEPSLKPAGSIGLLGHFIGSGLFERWLSAGVEVVAWANGDDAGFRIDPAVLAMFEEHPSLDAVVLAAPMGIRGTTRDGSFIRGDATGWCEDEHGMRGHLRRDPEGWSLQMGDARPVELSETAQEKGGVVCRLGDSRTAVVEGPAMATAPPVDWPFSTNQVYLRLASLGGLLEDSGSLPSMLARLPVYAERKTVTVDESKRDALQLFQPVSDILRLLDHVESVDIRRYVTEDQPGFYGPLKDTVDIGFVQRQIDRLGDSALHFTS